MGFSSLHVCMESSDHWLQGTIEEESGMDSSSPSGEMLACSRPLIERRLRPPHDQALKCPRCDSTHTKFCYYNNYSLSQPRYFCKTCRRYWTKGGTLRNIPVGGGCRKNKKISNKNKSNNNNDHQPTPLHPAVTNITSPTSYLNNPKHPHPHHLQLASFPDVQFSHHHLMLDNPIRPIDFMESKLEGIIGSTSSSTNFNNFMGNSDSLGMVGIGIGDMNINAHHHHHHHHNLTSGFGGMSMNMMTSLDGGGNNINVMESCQRLMLPYDASQDQSGTIDVKPNPKLLSLEWQDQNGSCSDVGKDSFGYLNGLGSWTGMINGYGSSTTTNPPLV